MQDFRRLRVWQRAHQFRLRIYAVAKSFPIEERYGLTAQIRRAASSIAANIAESCGYRGGLDSARFLQSSIGSCCEVLDDLIAAEALGYLSAAALSTLESELMSIRRMLVALIDRMRSKPRA